MIRNVLAISSLVAIVQGDLGFLMNHGDLSKMIQPQHPSDPTPIVPVPRRSEVQHNSHRDYVRGAPNPGHLEGIFVIDCVDGRSAWDIENDTRPEIFALGATVQYSPPADPSTDDPYSFELDKTEDSGTVCTPDEGYKSELVSKFNWRGDISFVGTSPNVKGSYQVMRTFAESTILIPPPSENNYVVGTVEYLNKYCPCGVVWKPGVLVTAYAGNCTNVTSASGDLCRIIAGAPLYSLYKWTDLSNPDHRTFVASQGQLDRIHGWSFDSYSKYAVPAEGLAQSDAHHPQDCDDLAHQGLIYQCKSAGIFDLIPDRCDGCQGLECTGCIFRHLNHTKDEFKTPADAWTDCCPCLWYEGTQNGDEYGWMKVDC
eukprot:m.93050 g.93050  ORF g.93050 m.93050 type:complete len:371 (-) comp26599_c0_seq1:60-1172(-)